MILATLPPDLAHFGVAGLMGAMWLWERRTSQKREQQLDESHTRILGDRVQLEQLIALVRDNTESMQRLAGAQEQLAHQLRDQHTR
jgi:hypothetical protein